MNAEDEARRTAVAALAAKIERDCGRRAVPGLTAPAETHMMISVGASYCPEQKGKQIPVSELQLLFVKELDRDKQHEP